MSYPAEVLTGNAFDCVDISKRIPGHHQNMGGKKAWMMIPSTRTLLSGLQPGLPRHAKYGAADL
jgi:hypothetical protein